MRALVVDRSEICRSGYKAALEENFENSDICEACNLEEALQCLDNHGVDIVLLNLDKKLDFKDAQVLRLKDYASQIPVLVVGNAVSKSLVREVFENNVRGFLDRSASRDVTMAAVQLILAGGHYFPPEVHDSFRSMEANLSSRQFKFSDDIAKLLTPRQIQVLQAISEGKSNKGIADELGISPGTVKVHVSNLMKDLQAKNRTQAVSIANNLQILN